MSAQRPPRCRACLLPLPGERPAHAGTCSRFCSDLWAVARLQVDDEARDLHAVRLARSKLRASRRGAAWVTAAQVRDARRVLRRGGRLIRRRLSQPDSNASKAAALVFELRALPEAERAKRIPSDPDRTQLRRRAVALFDGTRSAREVAHLLGTVHQVVTKYWHDAGLSWTPLTQRRTWDERGCPTCGRPRAKDNTYCLSCRRENRRRRERDPRDLRAAWPEDVCVRESPKGTA